MVTGIEHAPTAEGSLESLVVVLLDDVDRITEQAARRLQASLRSYGPVAVDDLCPVAHMNISNLLRLVLDPGMDRGRAELAYRESGETRASQGVTADDMLNGWRIGMETLREEAHHAAATVGVGDDVLLAFLEAMLRWGDVGMIATASAHREAEFETARHEEHHRTNLVRGILFGTVSTAAVRIQALAFGLDPAGSYHAVRARPGGDLTVRALERQLGVADGAGPRRGLAALVDGDLAGFVLAPLPETVAATVGVGPAVPLHELANSFRLATRAFEGAAAIAAQGPVEMNRLGLWPAVLADRDVGDELLRRIIDPVCAEGKAGLAALETVERYLANDLRLSVTAEQMFLHVNTVRYVAPGARPLLSRGTRRPRATLSPRLWRAAPARRTLVG